MRDSPTGPSIYNEVFSHTAFANTSQDLTIPLFYRCKKTPDSTY